MKLIPATVASWDGVTLRIHIPGYTDGADIPPKAAICYPFGDRSHYTGFKILQGDAVWVFFNDGDVNQPIVMGFRDANTGQAKNTRRFIHQNVEITAEIEMKHHSTTHIINADSLFEVKSGKIVLKSDVEITGSLTTKGALSGDGGMSVSGNVRVTGNVNATGDLTARKLNEG